MPKLSVTVITRDEADNLAAALESVAWADEIVVVDSESTDDTVAIARRYTSRVTVRPWPGYVAQKNHAAAEASHDWILSLDADERVSAELAAEIRGLMQREPEAAGFRVPRVTFYLGRWIRSTDWYPDYQLRLYDRRRATWQGRHVHESVRADGPVADLRHELRHHAYRDLSHHLQTMDRYTTLAARQMREDGRRAGWADLALHPPAAFLRNYVLRGGYRDGVPGLIISLLNAAYVALKFAKLWELVFSLHLDTAITWRGGQHQVLLTVLGLRERGHRAVLVAHPGGVLYRRASEGDDLVPLSPRSEVDLASAWRLSKVIASYAPDVVHAHDPHAVAMASLALSFGARATAPRLVASRRVDFQLQKHSFSRWKYRQVELFVAASSAIKDILVRDGIPASRVVVVHDGIDVERVAKVPPADIHQTFWFPKGAPVVVNVGALVNHKGQKFLVEAMAQARRQIPDAQLVIFGEGDLREPLTRQIHELGLDKHVVLAGFRDDVLGLTRSADLFVMSSVTEGLGSAVLDAMALGLPVVGTRAGGIPEAVEDGVTGRLVPPGRADALADAIVLMLRDPATRQKMSAAGRSRVEAEFGLDRLVEGTLSAYRRALARNPTSQAAS